MDSLFFLSLFFKTFLCIYLAALGLSSSMWNLVPWPGSKARLPALGVQSLSLWTTREVSKPWILIYLKDYTWVEFQPCCLPLCVFGQVILVLSNFSLVFSSAKSRTRLSNFTSLQRYWGSSGGVMEGWGIRGPINREPQAPSLLGSTQCFLRPASALRGGQAGSGELDEGRTHESFRND